MKRAPLLIVFGLLGCGRYGDFVLPVQPGSAREISIEWKPQPAPVLVRGPAQWDSVDVLNPSVLKTPERFLNLYSGFDGRTWRTGLATSLDGLRWTKAGIALEGDPYIAANGSVVDFRGHRRYYYQFGRTPSIRMAEMQSTAWRDSGKTILTGGPEGSWDEGGVADPNLTVAGDKMYLYYTGIDRARRQRLGVAVSDDGLRWTRLRSNPILELGDREAFDGNGLGEPAVFVTHGYYWMLYTGRAPSEQRRIGIARSTDGVHWMKLPQILEGDQPWNAQVLCDPTVIVQENGDASVWFGGGDIPRPDENIHGQIGYGILSFHP